MSLFKLLPPKVFQSIIDYLSPVDVYNGMFVCKLFKEYALKAYYREILLNKDRLEDMSLLQQYGISRSYLYKHGSLVEKVTICEDKHANIEPGRIMKDLALVLPNLKTIDISSSYLCEEYLYYGLNIEVRTKNLKLEQLIVPQNRCIPIYDDNHQSNKIPTLYNSACNKFRHTLTHLVVRGIESQYWFNKKDMTYSRYIAQFPNLTHLTVWNNYAFKSFNGDDTAVLSVILKACPFLISLELRNSFSFDENCSASSAEMLALNREVNQHEINRNYEQRARYNITPAAKLIIPPFTEINSVQAYNAQMRKLILVLPTISVIEMDYIMSFIPSSQLHKLEIILTRDTIDAWIERNIITTFEFARYLCMIPSLKFEVSNLTTDVKVQSLEPNLAQKSRLLRDFVHILLDSRRVKTLRTKLDVHNIQKSAKKFVNFSFNIINHQTLDFIYTLTHEDFIKEYASNTKSPFLQLFDSFWRCAKYNVLDVDVSYGDPTAVIKYVMNKYSDINELYIGCRKVDVGGKQYRIECNTKGKDITLHFENLNIQLDEDHFKHWARIIPAVTFMMLRECHLPCDLQPKKKLMDRLLNLDHRAPFSTDHYMIDLTVFRSLEDVALTLPRIKPSAKTSHTLFRNEFLFGNKGRDIKFRRSSNVPKIQMVSATEDADLNKTYVPVRLLDRRLITIKSYKAVSISVYDESDRGYETEVVFG